MKVIVFKDGENQLWLHMEDIKKIWSHTFAHFERTEIYFKVDAQEPKIKIYDYHKTNLSKLLYDFMKSQENFMKIKVKDLERDSSFNYHSMKLTDWVSQAMAK
jgi:hypothetical protein